MIRTPTTILLAITAALATSACNESKPGMGFAATLPPPPPEPAPLHPAAASHGAIYNPAMGFAALHEGTRARRVGDPLTIRLVERTNSAKSVNSRTSRDGGFSLSPPASGPLSFNPDVLNSSGQSSFKGAGSASQSSSLAGDVSVTIAEVRPNGTALVKGEKRVSLTQGEEWVQISGIVRLADIAPDNTIASARVADARIHYAGKGQVHRASREGWLQRFFNTISPF